MNCRGGLVSPEAPALPSAWWPGAVCPSLSRTPPRHAAGLRRTGVCSHTSAPPSRTECLYRSRGRLTSTGTGGKHWTERCLFTTWVIKQVRGSYSDIIAVQCVNHRLALIRATFKSPRCSKPWQHTLKIYMNIFINTHPQQRWSCCP